MHVNEFMNETLIISKKKFTIINKNYAAAKNK